LPEPPSRRSTWSSKVSPTSLNGRRRGSVEIAAARQTILNLLNGLAELRGEADAFLRATVTYAVDSRLLPQRQIADTARIALQTAQIWATKEGY
jgi:hypothetical protein